MGEILKSPNQAQLEWIAVVLIQLCTFCDHRSHSDRKVDCDPRGRCILSNTPILVAKQYALSRGFVNAEFFRDRSVSAEFLDRRVSVEYTVLSLYELAHICLV